MEVRVFNLARASLKALFIRRIAGLVIRQLGLYGEFEIIVASQELMQRLNSTYRRKNRAADVLSFSYSDQPALPRGQIFLDRRVISKPDKLTRLLAHAILHLAGYEHGNAKARRRMEKKEIELLSILREKSSANVLARDKQ